MWGSNQDNFNSFFAILAFLVVMVYPVFILVHLQINFNRLGADELFKQIYGTLYLNVNTKSRMAIMVNVSFLLRRFIFAACATSLAPYPSL